MKTIRLLFTLPLFLGLMAVLFQGCYTQVATMKEDEPSYEQEGQNSVRTDSASYDNANYDNDDNWQPHNYLGFSYYYPGWCSYWAGDYGCIYPTYWDPLWWGPAFYAGYAYYPYRWGYSYSRYGYGHSNYSRSFVTRNFGYQRGGNSLRNFGVSRSTQYGNIGTGTIYNGRVGSTGGSLNLSRASSTRTQLSATGTLKSHRGSTVSSNSRGSARSRGAALRRGGNSQGRIQSRGRQSRSGAPAARSSQSTPSRNSGGGQHSSGSGRSQR
ncbi:MAG: hypothetical protein ABSA44_09045 [Bacteroidota bacterium]|jgi:hypothetical protein